MPWPENAVAVGATLVLKAVPKFSVNVSRFTPVLVCVTHWLRPVLLLADVLRPLCTNPTVGVALVIGNVDGLLTAMDAITGVAPAAEPPLNTVALARILVIRKVRVMPVVPGGRTGTPNHVTELPVTMPWNTLNPLAAAVVAELLATLIGAPAVIPGALAEATVCTNSVQPVNGVAHTVCGAPGPNTVPVPVAGVRPEPGSSMSSSASESVLPPAIGSR